MNLLDKILHRNIISDPAQMTEEELGKAQQDFRRKYRFRMFGKTTVSVILSMALITGGIFSVFYFGMDVMTAYGTGMSPTVENGSYVFINKLAYRNRAPRRGDMIVSNGRIGRIVGLPGEIVRLYGGHVYINDAIADEAYIETGMLTYPYHGLEVFALGQQDYFILSDDRYCYSDSRDGIYVRPETIDGRVIASINPQKLKNIFMGESASSNRVPKAPAVSGVPAAGEGSAMQSGTSENTLGQ